MASNINCTDDLDDANYCDGVLNGSGSTVGLTTTTLATVAIPSGSQVRFNVEMSARRTDTTGTGWSATMTGTFQNNSGTVTQIGSTSVNDVDTSLLLLTTSALTISGTSVLVQGTGELSKTYSWRTAGKYIRTV